MVISYLPPLFPSWLSYRFPPALRIRLRFCHLGNPSEPAMSAIKTVEAVHSSISPTYSIYSPPDKKSKLVRHVKACQTKSRQRDHQIETVSFVRQALNSGSAAALCGSWAARLTRKPPRLWPLPFRLGTLLCCQRAGPCPSSRVVFPNVTSLCVFSALRKTRPVVQTFLVSGELL